MKPETIYVLDCKSKYILNWILNMDTSSSIEFNQITILNRMKIIPSSAYLSCMTKKSLLESRFLQVKHVVHNGNTWKDEYTGIIRKRSKYKDGNSLWIMHITVSYHCYMWRKILNCQIYVINSTIAILLAILFKYWTYIFTNTEVTPIKNLLVLK